MTLSKFKIDGVEPKEDFYSRRPEYMRKAKGILESPITIKGLAAKLDTTPEVAKIIIEQLQSDRFNVIQKGNYFELVRNIPEGSKSYIDLKKFENKWYKFGFVTDNHINSKYERLDVLNALYDIFEEEGVREVYNAGNYVDGECRFNKYDLINTGITPQIEYFLEKYPQRKGIITKYIAGDDHEGWWVQREKINIGEYTQMKAQEAGRTDLKYLGYLEADVIFEMPKGKCVMKIMHPGGGTAYALSYAPQKIVESFTGGEKPAILLIGHYHKADYLPYRNVHIVQGGTTEDQTPFMRKKKLQAHVGGWIVEFALDKFGAVTRFRTEWIGYYDREYYKRGGYYR